MLSKHTLVTERLCILNASSMLLLCMSLGNISEGFALENYAIAEEF